MDNIIVGRQPVLEALKSHQPIEKILTLHGATGSHIYQAKQLARKLAIPVKEMDKARFAELAGNTPAQGIIAIIDSYRYAEVQEILGVAQKKNEAPFILILDEIEDPHNLGALVRSAECAGAHGIIVPKHNSAPINATTVKSSAGATEHIPIAEETNIVSVLEQLKEDGFWIVGFDEEGDRDYTEVDYSTPVALVIGNEGKGIRRLVREHCDFVARIPVYGRIASLNASVAGGLALYEVARRRHQPGTQRQS
jgi:23S rRNA (guanosine2251-2'-O)-methyltransferase